MSFKLNKEMRELFNINVTSFVNQIPDEVEHITFDVLSNKMVIAFRPLPDVKK